MTIDSQILGSRALRFLGAAALLAVTVHAAPGRPSAETRTRIIDSYGKLPLSFEQNQGQTDSSVKFVSRGSGYGLFLTPDSALLTLSRGSARKGSLETLNLEMKVAGANPQVKVKGRDLQEHKSNYYRGSDPASWFQGVRNYGRVVYDGIYPGVDLVYYGNQRQLEYDFVVAPGADPSQIRLRFAGARNIRVDRSGDLVLTTAFGELRQKKPYVYQDILGKRQAVAGRYVIGRNNEVTFAVARYDAGKPLVIDPVLIYSTFFGGIANDQGNGIAIDTTGRAYVVGSTASTTLPIVAPANPFRGGVTDAFFIRLNPSGTGLVQSTYLGGSGTDSANGIALDHEGSIYIVGSSDSPNFPLLNPHQDSLGGKTDAFALKLNADGLLQWSTFMGGFENEAATAVAVDGNRNVYIGGTTGSTNFFATGGFQQFFFGGLTDGFIFKFNTDGVRAWSSYIGGNKEDVVNGIAVDANGSAYLTGSTISVNFPVANAIQSGLATQTFRDAFITKVNPAGNGLVYSTYIGGSAYDEGFAIGVDSTGAAYVAGDTDSTNFPVLGGTQQLFAGTRDVFVVKMNPAGSARAYSTYLGGSGNDGARDIAVEPNGISHIVGQTSSVNFPVNGFVQGQLRGVSDAFITRLSADGATRLSSTYFGGSAEDAAFSVAVDTGGNEYITGVTGSTDYPILGSVIQTTHGGLLDAFVTKISNCIVTLNPSQANVGAASTVVSFSVTAATDCPYGVATSDPFITILSVSNNVIQVSVAQNTSAPRTGLISVGGSTFTLNQAGATIPGCLYPLQPSGLIAAAEGATGNVLLTTTDVDCVWTGSSTASWLQFFPTSGTGPQTLRFTVFPNFSTQVRVATFTVNSAGGSQNFIVSQAGAVGTPDERFVKLVYFNFFGRNGTPDEIAFQVNAGLNAGLSRANLVMNFLNSAEFNAGGRFVAGVYVGLLGRDAEFGGWLFQRDSLARGIITPEGLVTNVLNSPEFFQRYGNQSNADFVRTLYLNILLRLPTQQELDFQVNNLATFQTTRPLLATAFLNSTEFRSLNEGRLTAFLLYATLLQRGPSGNELAFRAAQLQTGTPLITLVRDFLNTVEFALQVQ